MVQTGLSSDIGERAVAIVVVERVPVDAANEQVRVAIIVIITDSNANIVARAGEARFLGDVGEDAIAIVAVKPIVELGGVFLESFDVGAVREKNVRPAISVVVERPDAARHGGGCVGSFQRFVRVDKERKRLKDKADFRLDWFRGLCILRN